MLVFVAAKCIQAANDNRSVTEIRASIRVQIEAEPSRACSTGPRPIL
jgi:hypothetical protein